MSKPVNSRLGRGLESLLPSDFDSGSVLSRDERIQKLLIEDILPNPDQPRKSFDEASLEELANSIIEHGVLQPIIVSPKNGRYELIAGERRWRASQRAGQTSIPAIVREKAELERLQIALIENVQRVDLSPLEQASSIEYLHQQFNQSYQDIAKQLGKAVSTVNNLVRLLQLPAAAREALKSGRISEGHARSILALKGEPGAQQQLLDLIIKNNWSVRQAEQFVTAHKQGLKTTTAVSSRAVRETSQTKALSKTLGTKVTIHHTARGGRLELHFKTEAELNRLYDRLGTSDSEL